MRKHQEFPYWSVVVNKNSEVMNLLRDFDPDSKLLQLRDEMCRKKSNKSFGTFMVLQKMDPSTPSVAQVVLALDEDQKAKDVRRKRTSTEARISPEERTDERNTQKDALWQHDGCAQSEFTRGLCCRECCSDEQKYFRRDPRTSL